MEPMTSEQIDRLPRYVQDEIRRLRNSVALLERRFAKEELGGPAWTYFGDLVTGLGEDTVFFAPERDDVHLDSFTVRYEPRRLIIGSSREFLIAPRSSNMIEVEMVPKVTKK